MGVREGLIFFFLTRQLILMCSQVGGMVISSVPLNDFSSFLSHNPFEKLKKLINTLYNEKKMLIQ